MLIIDALQTIGVYPEHVAAGWAGGVVYALAQHPPPTAGRRRVTIGGILLSGVVGGVTANYLSDVAHDWIGIKSLTLDGTSFIVGVCAEGVIEFIHRFVERRLDDPTRGR